MFRVHLVIFATRIVGMFGGLGSFWLVCGLLTPCLRGLAFRSAVR